MEIDETWNLGDLSSCKRDPWTEKSFENQLPSEAGEEQRNRTEENRDRKTLREASGSEREAAKSVSVKFGAGKRQLLWIAV